MSGTDKSVKTLCGGPAIILVDPQLGQNIGMVARAMLNCGLEELRLVRPRDGWPNSAAESAASGAGVVLEKTRLFDTTAEAVADLNRVYAATARPRGMITPVVTPRQAAAELRAALARETGTQETGTQETGAQETGAQDTGAQDTGAQDTGAGGTRAGVMFGPERSGLVNDDIALADTVLSVPLNPAFASLNLAQAVFVVGYEWLISGSEADSGALGRELSLGATRPATKAELIGLFERLEAALDARGFLYPVEKRPAMVRNLRNLFQRAQLTEQEVRTLHGIVSLLRPEADRDEP
jgi:tRNA/rRNA methyltransferase